MVYEKSLMLNTESETILKGGELALVATTVPSGKDVVWSSSDEETATVSPEGVVKGIKGGVAEIYAESMGLKKTCVITVVDKTDIQGITLDRESVILRVNETAQHTATLAPGLEEESIKWRSLKNSVATVDDNGLVTAVGEGTTKIIARAGRYLASCDVTVISGSSGEEP
jgi:uncharacterized protein YjdB